MKNQNTQKLDAYLRKQRYLKWVIITLLIATGGIIIILNTANYQTDEIIGTVKGMGAYQTQVGNQPFVIVVLENNREIHVPMGYVNKNYETGTRIIVSVYTSISGKTTYRIKGYAANRH